MRTDDDGGDDPDEHLEEGGADTDEQGAAVEGQQREKGPEEQSCRHADGRDAKAAVEIERGGAPHGQEHPGENYQGGQGSSGFRRCA